jgi:plasmid stabilization system protein ParE
MKFRLLRPAWRELREAAKYYEDRVPGLGFDFLKEVRAAIRRILMHPEAWFALGEEIRRCRTHRFPYGIIYTIERDEVLIVSVMHLHRHPESWRRNLT